MNLSIGYAEPRFLLNNFFCDNSNNSVFSAAKLITLGQVFRTPIYIHSEAGLGKTHLLHAIANATLKRAPRAKIALISSEWFATELMSAIQTDALEDFTYKFLEGQNIFMIDELSFINKKPLIQKELFRILKEQSENGCRIVLASSITLDAMTNWHKEFREWLQSGELYIITNPSADARKLFIKKLLAKNKITINDDLIECFHREAGASFRELEGVILRVRAAANLYNAELTVEFTMKTLRKLAAT